MPPLPRAGLGRAGARPYGALVSADPVAGLAGLPGVAEAAEQARAAIDSLLWDRGLRARMAEVVAASRLRGGWASAALDGADVRPESLRAGAEPDGSPIGRVVAAALRLQQLTPRLVAVSERTPMQAWAALHSTAAYGFVPQDQLGRPRAGQRADDPLRLGPVPPAPEVAPRLDALARLLAGPSTAPAVLLAGVAHAELATLRPFTWGSGLVARAALRLVLAGRGADPDGVCVPEAGVLAAGRPAYAQALRGYATGSPEGVGGWLVYSCQCIREGALEARRAYENLPPR